MSSEPVIVRREIVIEASPSLVFDAWTNPGQIVNWYVDRAESDARNDERVVWVIGGTEQALEVTAIDRDRRLMLTNVGSDQWKGTVLDLTFEPEGPRGSTRLVVEQTTPAASLREFMPSVDSGWACTLAVLKEYLEQHPGDPRTQVEAHRSVTVDIEAVGEAFASLDAIADWAEDRPARLLVSAPRGAVVAFADFPGVFTVMGVGGAHVAYAGWGNSVVDPVKTKVATMADRLYERIKAVG